MAQKPIAFANFSGGWSIDGKVGAKFSFGSSIGFDFRKQPTRLSVLPGLAKESAGAVTDLVQNEIMGPDGTIYALGETGQVYKRNTSGVWSVEGNITTNGTFGMDYRRDTDDIYITGTKAVTRYESITTAPAFLNKYYADSYSTYDNSTQAGFNVKAYQTGSSSTYTPPTAISEDDTNRRYFQSDIEPLDKISVWVAAAGTGDWTVTLHDGNNKELASATVANADLVANAFNDFVFSSATNGQVRIYVAPNARTYHIHVTSTVADGTCACSTLNDLRTADLEVWADRLVQTNNGMHPIDRFLQYEVIGNGNYLSVWEPISDPPTNDEWKRHKLVFPMEYECCGLAHTNEYEVVALEKTSTTNTLTPQAGLIAFWDGVSPTYNYYLEVPEGSPYALHAYENVIYYYAGGIWYEMTSPTTLPQPIRMMPGSDTEFSGTNSPITVYPYCATTRRNIQLLAYPSKTTNTSINFGVYSYGSLYAGIKPAFGKNYILSTGTQNYTGSNNLRIGMIKNFGDILHVSWQDDLNGGYGVDSITNASNPAASATWQSLIIDMGYAAKFKEGIYVEAYYSLPADATMQLGYSLDRGNFVNDINLYSTTNLWQGRVGYARFNISANQTGIFHEIQAQVIAASNGATTPAYIYYIGLVVDNKQEEMLS
jgi:hypothetical protein